MQTQRFGEHVAAWLVLVAVRPDEQSQGPGQGARARRRRARARSSAPPTCCSRARSRATSGRVSTPPTPAPACCSRRSASSAIGSARTWRSTRRSVALPRRRHRRAGDRVRAHMISPPPRFRIGYPSSTGPSSLGTAFAARDADGATIGFGCHSVNRGGLDRPDGHRSDAPARRRRFGGARRCLRRSRTAWVRDRRDRLGEQPALLRQVRRSRLASSFSAAG